MWDIIIALVFVYPAVEIVEEWRRRRVANRLLAEMRKHMSATGWTPCAVGLLRELFGLEALVECVARPRFSTVLCNRFSEMGGAAWRQACRSRVA